MATAAGMIPPQDLDAERAVLGAMLLDPDAIDAACEIIAETAYQREAHRLIHAAILAVRATGETPDIVTVGDHMATHGGLDRVGGNAYLAELAGEVLTTANVGNHARIVREKATLRGLIQLADDMRRHAFEGRDPEELLAAADSLVSSLREGAATRTEPRLITEAVREALDAIERREPMPGTPTGWADLDGYIGGIRPGELVVIGGRPSSGKTAFGLLLAQRIARPKAPALVVSLETSERMLAYRVIAQASGVPVAVLMRRMASQGQIEHARRAVSMLDEHPVVVDDAPHATIADIGLAARRVQRRRGLSAVLVDYLTLIDAEGRRGESRASAVERVAHGLREIARRLDVAVIALSQLNRQSEHRTGSRVPELADLRESGGVEQDANVVILLHRPAAHSDTADPSLLLAKVAKNKDGPIGTVHMNFDTPTMRIMSREDKREEEPA